MERKLATHPRPTTRNSVRGFGTTRPGSFDISASLFPGECQRSASHAARRAWCQLRAFACAKVNFRGMPTSLWSHAFVVTRSSALVECLVRGRKILRDLLRVAPGSYY